MIDAAIERAVEMIWNNLCDRAGIGDALSACDNETQKEIRSEIFKTIDEAAYWSWTQDGKDLEKSQ